MASGGDTGRLTDELIARLAAVISIHKMKSIAESYLRVDHTAIENKAYDAGDSEDLNREILRQWRNQHRGQEQIKALAHILYRAAKEHGYINPDDVMTTLGVSREDATLHSVHVTNDEVTEDDLRTIADRMKPFYKRKMKITQYPWQKSRGVDMDKLSVDLSLEEAVGRNSKKLKNYKELFDPSMQDEGERILLKGEPGTGKTTLMKKITHDWVKGMEKGEDWALPYISIVFFIFLKFVKQGEAIENVIVNRIPNLKVTPDKVKRVLEKFGPRYLLVLDGLDEHAKELNTDVISIIERSKYPDCKVIVTTRPHRTSDVEVDDFDTIGKVEGFTRDEARKFVEHTVDDKQKVRQVLNFNPTSSRGDIRPPLHKVPILLSIMCFLVLEDENVSSLLNQSTNKGWIYFRMIRCLYKTYVEKGQSKTKFDINEFVKVVRSVGKLAWETLLSEDPQMFSKEEVIEKVGKDVFAWGLLIGDEDADRLTDETKDILVDFAHRSIHEFFGAFYFILSLGEGKSVESLLGVNCTKLMFMENPLFLEFCLWLMQTSVSDLKDFFPEKEQQEKAYSELAAYMAKKIDQKSVNLHSVGLNFPALHVTSDPIIKEMILPLVQDVLSRCSKMEHLGLDSSHPVVELLLDMNPCLHPQINTLSLEATQFRNLRRHAVSEAGATYVDPENRCPETELIIQLQPQEKIFKMFDIVMRYSKLAGKRTCVYVKMQPPPDPSKFFERGLHGLHLDCDNLMGVECHSVIPNCPSLKHLSVTNLRKADDVLTLLSEAIKKDYLKNLNYLDFSGCSFTESDTTNYRIKYEISPFLSPSERISLKNYVKRTDIDTLSAVSGDLTDLGFPGCSLKIEEKDSGILHLLFPAGPPALEHLNLCGVKLNSGDLRFIVEMKTLCTLILSDVSFVNRDYEILSRNHWSTLTKLFLLGVSFLVREAFVSAVNEARLSTLVKLHLSGNEEMDSGVKNMYRFDPELPEIRADLGPFPGDIELQVEKLPWLKKLTIEGLINSSKQLESLVEKLVIWDLEYLNIGGSKDIMGNLPLMFRPDLLSLETLVVRSCDLDSGDMRCYTDAREQNKMRKLKHLDVSENPIKDRERWKRMEAWKDVRIKYS